jgi:hypothetical protein
MPIQTHLPLLSAIGTRKAIKKPFFSRHGRGGFWAGRRFVSWLNWMATSGVAEAVHALDGWLGQGSDPV